jgi:RimJ/RimL family protein N-acetyltransferase
MLPAMTAQVRLLTPDDWQTLRDIRLAALADAPEAFLTTYADMVGLDEEQWRARTTRSDMFAAFVGGEAVGMVGLFADPSGDFVLIAMWVAPALRGTGVAGPLIEAAAARAAERGGASVRLEVAPGNVRAEKAYGRHGFALTDEAPEIDGGIIMRRAL